MHTFSQERFGRSVEHWEHGTAFRHGREGRTEQNNALPSTVYYAEKHGYEYCAPSRHKTNTLPSRSQELGLFIRQVNRSHADTPIAITSYQICLCNLQFYPFVDIMIVKTCALVGIQSRQCIGKWPFRCPSTFGCVRVIYGWRIFPSVLRPCLKALSCFQSLSTNSPNKCHWFVKQPAIATLRGYIFFLNTGGSHW